MPPRTTDESGRHWVRLSDEEPVVPLLAQHAERARCETVTMDHWTRFAEIELACERSCRAEKTPTKRGTHIEQICSYEQISVIQHRDMLGFQCSSLPATPCETMVRHLANGGAHSLNALGGAMWGIR